MVDHDLRIVAITKKIFIIVYVVVIVLDTLDYLIRDYNSKIVVLKEQVGRIIKDIEVYLISKILKRNLCYVK